MSGNEWSALLGAGEGHRVKSCGRFAAGERGPRAVVWIEPEPIDGRALRCSGCGERVERVHDTVARRVRDLPVLDADTWLQVPRCRVACPRCGPKLELRHLVPTPRQAYA